jgi:hypothetical protein
MNKFGQLRDKWSDAVQQADDARTELENFVYPIIRILEGIDYCYTITSISRGKTSYRIETVGEDRDAWRDHHIPTWIIEADDPLLAATNHVKTEQAEKEKVRQHQIRAEIERLQGLVK